MFAKFVRLSLQFYSCSHTQFIVNVIYMGEGEWSLENQRLPITQIATYQNYIFATFYCSVSEVIIAPYEKLIYL